MFGGRDPTPPKDGREKEKDSKNPFDLKFDFKLPSLPKFGKDAK